MKAKMILGAFMVCGCAWAFLTGDFMTPCLISLTVVPAAYAAAEGLL